MQGVPEAASTVVGAKQTAKALQSGRAEIVYLAKDADHHVIAPIRELCRSQAVSIVEVETMAELGRACSIAVGAAVAAVLK